MRLGILGLALWLGLAGCMKNTSPERVSWRQTRGTGLPSPETLQRNQNPNQPTPSWGRVWAKAEHGQAFNQAIKALVSATIPPEYVGWVDPLQGVRIKGYVPLDAQGRVIPKKGVLEMEIQDSWVGQVINGETVEPIRIRVPVESGWAWGGQFQVDFVDSYGRIRLEGRYQDGGKARGYLSFRNTNGGWGQHLQFEVDTCQFFTCQ